MAVLAGIDEAGYGPILGPLVVSACSFQIPDELLKADLWQILNKSVAKQRKNLAGRLLITDSKKAFVRKSGTRHLKRATLACLRDLGSRPGTLKELLDFLCPDCIERLADYPWYADIVGSILDADYADIKIASEVFGNNMSQNGMKLLSIQTQCLDVAHYNRLIDKINNKASVLFLTTAGLIKSIWDNSCDDNIQIIVDRQGGRSHYRKKLQTMFPDLEMAIIGESDSLSSYELKGAQKQMRIHFVTKADQKHLPVSLASMVSKYVRELLVERINCYWQSHHAELKPTAGYWKDGLRFIADLKKHVPHVIYESEKFIRSR